MWSVAASVSTHYGLSGSTAKPRRLSMLVLRLGLRSAVLSNNLRSIRVLSLRNKPCNWLALGQRRRTSAIRETHLEESHADWKSFGG